MSAGSSGEPEFSKSLVDGSMTSPWVSGSPSLSLKVPARLLQREPSQDGENMGREGNEELDQVHVRGALPGQTLSSSPRALGASHWEAVGHSSFLSGQNLLGSAATFSGCVLSCLGRPSWPAGLTSRQIRSRGDGKRWGEIFCEGQEGLSVPLMVLLCLQQSVGFSRATLRYLGTQVPGRSPLSLLSCPCSM